MMLRSGFHPIFLIASLLFIIPEIVSWNYVVRPSGGPRICKPNHFRLHSSPSTSNQQPENLVFPIDLNSELKTSFMSYAMSTILGRALPDLRDGLKPVHRRILHAMNELRLTPDSSYRKCARIVGEVLGKFHPHGDQSVYDALVRMAQDFVMQHPLISGHGNFGSVDNDPAAAMRYTEAKLSSIAYDSLLVDISENTVDFVKNFDGNEEEPIILPARLPILLLNGANGIAVGMATNIPPHNLNEVVDGMIALIDKPELTDEELIRIIPAPDFPTGGEIVGISNIKDFYLTGHGSIQIRGKATIESSDNQKKSSSVAKPRSQIVITELPYMVNKAGFLEKIAELVNEKKIEGISDLRDESDRDGIRIVIELKKDCLPEIVLNNLFLKTDLQINFPGNLLALTQNGTVPQRLSLKTVLTSFIEFRYHTIRRRSSFQLQKLQQRDHLVLGLVKAMSKIDTIIKIMKTSPDTNQARASLMKMKENFSSEQVEAILGLTLRRITALEEKKLNEEHIDLTKRINQLQSILQNPSEVYSIMKNESIQLKSKYGQPRKSQIIFEEQKKITTENLLANDRSIIILTDSGYIKRIPISQFESQSKGGKGKIGTKLSTSEDNVKHFFSCHDHDSLLFISEDAVAYQIKAYQIPITSRTARGAPLPSVIPIKAGESISAILPVDSKANTNVSVETNQETNEVPSELLLLSRKGRIKRLSLESLRKITARGLIVMKLNEGDGLKFAKPCVSQDEIIIATRAGYAARFPLSQVPESGRTTKGVGAINLREDDDITDCTILPRKFDPELSTLIAITEKGFGKRILLKTFASHSRKGKGIRAIKFKQLSDKKKEAEDHEDDQDDQDDDRSQKPVDSLKCLRYCEEDDEIILSTNKGTITRQPLRDITIQSRYGTGSRIQMISDNEVISNVDIISPDEAADE